MTYEDILKEYEKEVLVKEIPLKYHLKGLYRDGKVIIDSNIETDSERCCILCEELGHHFTSYGNIIDLCDIRNVKQEHIARRWAYEKLVDIMSLVQAYENNIISNYELAEHLNVTVDFLAEAIEYYKSKYGPSYKADNYIINFYPSLDIEKL